MPNSAPQKAYTSQPAGGKARTEKVPVGPAWRVQSVSGPAAPSTAAANTEALKEVLKAGEGML